MKQSIFFPKSSIMNNTIPLLCISVCFFLIIIVTNTTLTFASTEISSSVGTLRLNQDLFEVYTGSPEIVKVYGSVLSANRGDKITVIFTMPDGETEGSQVFPTKDGLFENFLRLDDNSQLGTYTVFASFNSVSMGTLTFSVVQKQFSVKDNIIPSPQTTYRNTFLSLQVQDGTNQGYIKVLPTLTYGAGGKLSTNNVSISIDGISKTTVSSNQLSSDIYAGSGADHTIKASVPETTSNTNTLIKYRSSSDTVNYFVKDNIIPSPLIVILHVISIFPEGEEKSDITILATLILGSYFPLIL